MQAETGLSSSAVALILLADTASGATIATAAAVLNLSHSATVRVTAEMVARGLILRGSGADRRAAALTLTPEGAAMAVRLRVARAGVLAGLAAVLPPDGRDTLEHAITAMLCHLARDRRTTDHLCRFCDEVACGGTDCPVERHTTAVG
jgi:DNA-binding MarR family transcriptional regulator